jgi:cytochrome c553
MKLSHAAWLAAPCALGLALLAAAQATAADAGAGKKKVASSCAVCHGLDGLAKNPDAPNLAGESPSYIVKQLKAFKSGERQHEQMSIIAQSLSDDDIANVAAWFSKIKVTVQMPQ